MKTISKITLTVITLFFITACSNENNNFTEESIDYEEVFANKIGYVDVNTKRFNEINESQLTEYWKTNFELSSDLEFNKVKLIKAKIEKGEEQYYILNATSKNGKINISSKILLNDNGFRMSGEECKCESTGCTFGCEVLSMCSCSSCSRPGSCKKTHTVKELDDGLF
tara:strand:- start:78 stop:581 length:504 start_codon:yes stop_codon:yes gene_type:complete